ncbi:unnamed protein product [Diamesa tonsa]
MKITLAIVLLFGVFVVIMSDSLSPSSEENSGEYVDRVDSIREKRQARFPNGTIMTFPANGNKTWQQNMAPGMGPGHGNGTWQGHQGMGQGQGQPGNWQGKPPQKQ